MEEACAGATAGDETTGAVFWSPVSIFIEETALTADMRSVTCWRASSRHTHGVLSLQKPQSKFSNEPPGSNRLDFPEVASSKIPLRP